MTTRLRWAVYRDRQPLSPVYLGDVLACDRESAERDGATLYGGRVVVHRGGTQPGRPVTPELERAARSVTKRDSRKYRGYPTRGRAARRDGDA